MTAPTPCPRCEGQGEITHPRTGHHACPERLAACPTCAGTGQLSEGLARSYRNHHTPRASRFWPPIPEQEEQRPWPA